MSYLNHFNQNLEKDSHVFVPDYNKFTRQQSVVDGVITTSGSFQPASIKDTFGNCPSYEFSIANYEALGIVDKLQNMSLPNRDVDGMVNFIDSLNTDSDV